MNENITKVISPFQVRCYMDVAEGSNLAVFDGDIITVEETYGLDANDFLQSDFGADPI